MGADGKGRLPRSIFEQATEETPIRAVPSIVELGAPHALRSEAEQLLAAHPYVDADADHLTAILLQCQLRPLAVGDLVCREGESAQELYFLLAGTVLVVKQDPGGTEQPIGEVTAPTLIGQMAIIDRTRRTATCIAATPVRVAVLAWPTFHSIIQNTEPHGVVLRRLLLSSLTRQLIASNGRLRLVLAARADPTTEAAKTLSEEANRASELLEGWTEEIRQVLPSVVEQAGVEIRDLVRRGPMG
jgi:CRP-like cAMP-binding protein